MKLTVLEDLNLLTGKTLKYVHTEEYGYSIFITEDDCILIFETQNDDMLYIEESKIGRFFATHHKILKELLSQGIIKEEQVQAEIKAWNDYYDRVKKECEERERKEYERLKAKFEK